MANIESNHATTESVGSIQESTAASNYNGSNSAVMNRETGHHPDSNPRYSFRRELVAFLGEFVGTFLFLFFAFTGTQVANNLVDTPDASTLLYISLAFGFSLSVNAWAFYKISGGLFNPAVTLGLFLSGCFTWLRSLVFFIAQLLGSIASAGVVSCLFPGRLNVTTKLTGGTSIAQGVFIEMFLTAELVFVILMLAVEKHRATFLAPIGIGLAFFVAELSGVAFTGGKFILTTGAKHLLLRTLTLGSLNPARSMAPAIVNASFPGYFWIYWVGPLLGAALAAGFYRLVKLLEYEVYGAPTQDSRYPIPKDQQNIYPIRSHSVFHAGSPLEAQRPPMEHTISKQ